MQILIMSASVFGISTLFVCLGALLMYHLYSFTSVFFCHDPSIQLFRNLQNSLVWLYKHRKKDDAPSVTLAIQTLRNTIIVAIFVGGYSFQFATATISNIGLMTSFDMRARSLILAAFLFSSFLSWASVIRLASHLGYMIGTLEHHKQFYLEMRDIQPETKEFLEPEQQLDEDSPTSPQAPYPLPDDSQEFREAVVMTKKMLANFSLGFRFMFIAIPFAFYAAGPIALLVSTAIILVFLYNIDHIESPLAHRLRGETR